MSWIKSNRKNLVILGHEVLGTYLVIMCDKSTKLFDLVVLVDQIRHQHLVILEEFSDFPFEYGKSPKNQNLA